MITSVSDIQTYMRCRRRWDYGSSSRQNLTRDGLTKPALELGKLIHSALEHWTNYDPEKEYLYTDKEKTYRYIEPGDSIPVQFFLHESQLRIEEVKAQYLVAHGVSISDFEIQPLNESVILGHGMITNYEKRWGSALPTGLKFAVPEQEVLVAIPGTEHRCKKCYGTGYLYVGISSQLDCDICNGTGVVYHYLRAILDGIVQNLRDVFFVLERKTFEKRPAQIALTMAHQFVAYCWVLQQLKMEPLGGIAYDGLWKRQAVPKGKTLEDLFVRTVIPITQSQIDDFEKSLVSTVKEMASKPAIYPNRRWEGCYDCGFNELCVSESMGENVEFIIKHTYRQRERRENDPIGSTIEATA